MIEAKSCETCVFDNKNCNEKPCIYCKKNHPEPNNYPLLWTADVSENESDNVNHPAHYQGKHECIDEMIALFGVEAVKHFCMCNVYKYRFRAAKKNGKEDLDKAVWYIDKLIELIELDGDNNGKE